MKLGILFVATSATLAGTLGTFGTVLFDAGFSGFQVASIRMLITCVVLLAVYPVVFHGCFAIMRDNWKLLLPHSIAVVFGFSMLFFIATEYLGVTLAVALLYTAPIWVMILASFFLGEISGLVKWALVFCSVAGVAFVLNTQGQEIKLSLLGLCFGFGSAIGYAIFAVLGKIALRTISAKNLLFSALTFAIPLLLLFPSTWQGLEQLSQSRDLNVWGSFVAVSLLGTLLMNVLYMNGLTRINASTATVITTIEPLVATFLAVFIVQEILAPSQYFGVLLIIVSATLIGILDGRIKKESKN
ncbi:EamA family transporter [Lentilitoribacter sp. EG35]|uniref:EamA family transporter n=1 Tax=Lentilitoribacter sp. EG35 TaxID=3234192 RepID=UPI00345F48B0